MSLISWYPNSKIAKIAIMYSNADNLWKMIRYIAERGINDINKRHITKIIDSR